LKEIDGPGFSIGTIDPRRDAADSIPGRDFVPDLREIGPGLYDYAWSRDPEGPGNHALVLEDAGGVVVIDPLVPRLRHPGIAGKTSCIVVSTPGHQRAAWRSRALTGAPVYAPAGSRDLESSPDRSFSHGDHLPGGLVAIEAPGPADRHHVLLRPEGRGTIFCADLLINDPVDGLSFLPDPYLRDPVLTRHTAHRLLDLRFEALCFGHGDPIPSGGRRALEFLLRHGGRRRR
jgi:hypothetical protein